MPCARVPTKAGTRAAADPRNQVHLIELWIILPSQSCRKLMPSPLSKFQLLKEIKKYLLAAGRGGTCL
jgi:hypothetical protein